MHLTNKTKKDDDVSVDFAEQQLVGYAHAKRGYSLIDLISSMGMKNNEWEKIKSKQTN